VSAKVQSVIKNPVFLRAEDSGAGAPFSVYTAVFSVFPDCKRAFSAVADDRRDAAFFAETAPPPPQMLYYLAAKAPLPPPTARDGTFPTFFSKK
jgi:hypothetical protein